MGEGRKSNCNISKPTENQTKRLQKPNGNHNSSISLAVLTHLIGLAEIQGKQGPSWAGWKETERLVNYQAARFQYSLNLGMSKVPCITSPTEKEWKRNGEHRAFCKQIQHGPVKFILFVQFLQSPCRALGTIQNYKYKINNLETLKMQGLSQTSYNTTLPLYAS